MDITQEERAHITKLRDSLKGELSDHYNDDYNLLRWIRAWNCDFSEILPRIRKHLAFRKLLGLDNITDGSYIEQFGPVVQNFPNGVAGYDKEGNVIVIEMMGKVDPKGMLHAEKSSDFIRARMFQCERVMWLARQQEKKLGHKVGVFLISDLEGLTLEHIWMPAMHVQTTLITLMQDNYPELLQRLYMIKSPAAMQVGYRIILPFLSKHTKEKIHIIGSNWREKLAKLVEPDQLPVYLGGTISGPHGEYGGIRPGGPVPESWQYKPSDKDPSPSDLCSISIGRSDHKNVTVDIKQPGSAFSWYLKMPSHDIEFGVYKVHLDGRKEMVVPKFRINCEFVPETGSYTCVEGGTYLFEFDNSYSWLRAKTVQYKIDVKDPSITEMNGHSEKNQ